MKAALELEHTVSFIKHLHTLTLCVEIRIDTYGVRLHAQPDVALRTFDCPCNDAFQGRPRVCHCVVSIQTFAKGSHELRWWHSLTAALWCLRPSNASHFSPFFITAARLRPRFTLRDGVSATEFGDEILSGKRRQTELGRIRHWTYTP